ncbi:MAG: bifunctional nuclease family protein [Candidatus Methanoperedens sp.]
MNGSILTVRIKGVYLIQTMSGATPIVLLEDDTNRIMPIYIGLPEAISISAGLNNEIPPRPMTHDLIISLLEQFGSQIDNVLIDELNEGVYYARLSISLNGSKFEIDARPSDCIAIAVRSNATIHVREDVFSEAVVNIDELEGILSLDSFLSETG